MCDDCGLAGSVGGIPCCPGQVPAEVVPTALQSFADNGVRLVACPNGGATRSFAPIRGVLYFTACMTNIGL